MQHIPVLSQTLSHDFLALMYAHTAFTIEGVAIFDLKNTYSQVQFRIRNFNFKAQNSNAETSIKCGSDRFLSTQ